MHSTTIRKEADASDHLVWDIIDPFASPDPTQHRLRALMQAEIARMRRYESIGPLESLPDDVSDEFPCYCDSDDESDVDEDTDTDADADDEDDDEDRPSQIVLPRLLHTRPICHIPSRSPTPSSSAEQDSTEDEDEEQVHKATHDTLRSHLKALKILGPEAAEAVSSIN